MTHKLMKRACLILLAMPLAVSAQTIYRCTDADGRTLISNSRVNSQCKAIMSDGGNALPAPKASSGAPRASANPTPASFPRVQENAQRARDTDRRHILEQELAGEQRNLADAQKDLAAAGSAPEQAARQRERVAQHERNIQAIQKELANLR